MKKRILLLTTGGTIASQDGGNGLALVLSSDDFLDYMKEFEDVCELVPYEVCSIDSTNMEASWWLKLAGLIQKNYTLYDAFLICHGTETMAYTAVPQQVRSDRCPRCRDQRTAPRGGNAP